ncbi:MAG TPA: hypothetical protein VJ878_02805 [Candidatus Izemoplasmatales bacterium]|nr:hypothetical protein [Candidatus Izemoplasmatales bacterium]
MKRYLELIKKDIICLSRYHFLSMVAGLSFFFALLIGLTDFFPPMIYIYFSVFVLPVISFSVNLIIQDQQDENKSEVSIRESTISKIISATLIQLIPIIIYLIVLIFVLNYEFNIILFTLVYLLGALMHIVIGLTLSIIAKTPFALSLSYGVYLIVFSIIPIFYSVGMIPNDFHYLLIISPAYLSGVLFEEIIHPSNNFTLWFPLISVTLQFIYMFIMYRFVISPFIKDYMKLV